MFPYTQNWTGDEVKKLVYTSRQLNTMPLVPLFNCALVCTTAQLDMVRQQVLECYDHIDVLYWHNKAAATTGQCQNHMFPFIN